MIVIKITALIASLDESACSSLLANYLTFLFETNSVIINFMQNIFRILVIILKLLRLKG